MKLAAGQVAVVTGAASGIGQALSVALAARGLAVVLADIDGAAAQAAAATCGSACLGMAVDVADSAQMTALAARVHARFGRVDLLCNNAGVAPPPALLWDQPEAAWRWSLDVTLMGAVHGVKAFLPGMIARGSGHVVNTASLAGVVPMPLVAPYCSAKYALVGMTECLADELRVTAPGIGVSLLCPGMVTTRLSETSALHAPSDVASDAVPSADLLATLVARSGPVMTADAIAAMALDAIEASRLHVFTHGHLHRTIRADLFGG